jgi:galactonate dehydratase
VKITEVKTYLTGRGWIFVKVLTDEGIHGVGEGGGWPRVVATAVEDLAPVLIGEDPFHIEKLWHKLFVSRSGVAMTGMVAGGALSALEMALWDIKGKALGLPVWNLLGGKMHDRLRVYTHADSVEDAEDRVKRGYDGLKVGDIPHAAKLVRDIRAAVGREVDLMVDLHGVPWMTTRDAIAIGRALEEYGILFYEEPVSPENIGGLARIAREVNIPLASGERVANIHNMRELIEREIIDVAQPDTGRFGGLSQMKKLAGMAEAHHIMIAPHDGSLGPIAEMAAVHYLATIPNFLILEHREDDVPARYEVMTPQPEIENSYLTVPDTPGLGVDIVEDAVAKYPMKLGVSPPKDTYDYQYVFPRTNRAAWLAGDT